MRKRVLLAMLFPIAVFLWLAGWLLYWTGSQHRQEQPAAKENVLEIAAVEWIKLKS